MIKCLTQSSLHSLTKSYQELKGDQSSGQLSREEVEDDPRALLDRADYLHAVKEKRAGTLAILLKRRQEVG